MTASYAIDTHQHRFAAWAAASAASASPLCRFTVHQGVTILEAAGFTPALSHPDLLPDPAKLDVRHHAWRMAVITAALRLRLEFTHGIAAKLINVYLKSRFVCAGPHAHPRVQALHPPIDAVLLQSLAENDVGGHGADWRRMHRLRWSKYTSTQYQAAIDLIRRCVPSQPLWSIEAHWQGHQ